MLSFIAVFSMLHNSFQTENTVFSQHFTAKKVFSFETDKNQRQSAKVKNKVKVVSRGAYCCCPPTL